MTRILTTSLLIAVLLLSASCLQRTDSSLPTQADSGELPVNWELVASWGGDAVKSVESEDSWQVRFKPGGFVEIAGVCATDNEVYVCDLGISRIQVFDFDGNFLRSHGEGMPLEDTLPSDIRMWNERGGRYNKEEGRWEESFGSSWKVIDGKRFKAADVVVDDEGLLILDRARTAVTTSPVRKAHVYHVGWDGFISEPLTRNMYWPEYLANENGIWAISEPAGNSLVMLQKLGSRWDPNEVTSPANFMGIMDQEFLSRGSPIKHELMARVTGAGSAPGEFNILGGMAFGFNKLVACDTGNQRLQIFEARSDPRHAWGYLLRVVPAAHFKKGLRFSHPRDVDISAEGQVFVLDAELREVALLSPVFDRIGAFGHGTLGAPHHIDLSDDGRHCFITDEQDNMVYHYAASD